LICACVLLCFGVATSSARLTSGVDTGSARLTWGVATSSARLTSGVNSGVARLCINSGVTAGTDVASSGVAVGTTLRDCSRLPWTTANKSATAPHMGANIKGQIFFRVFSPESSVPEGTAGGTCCDESPSGHFTVLVVWDNPLPGMPTGVRTPRLPMFVVSPRLPIETEGNPLLKLTQRPEANLIRLRNLKPILFSQQLFDFWIHFFERHCFIRCHLFQTEP